MLRRKLLAPRSYAPSGYTFNFLMVAGGAGGGGGALNSGGGGGGGAGAAYEATSGTIAVGTVLGITTVSYTHLTLPTKRIV